MVIELGSFLTAYVIDAYPISFLIDLGDWWSLDSLGHVSGALLKFLPTSSGGRETTWCLNPGLPPSLEACQAQCGDLKLSEWFGVMARLEVDRPHWISFGPISGIARPKRGRVTF